MSIHQSRGNDLLRLVTLDTQPSTTAGVGPLWSQPSSALRKFILVMCLDDRGIHHDLTDFERTISLMERTPKAAKAGDPRDRT